MLCDRSIVSLLLECSRRFEFKSIPVSLGIFTDTRSRISSVWMSKSALHHLHLRLHNSQSQLRLERHAAKSSIIQSIFFFIFIIFRNQPIQLFLSFSCVANKTSCPAGKNQTQQEKTKISAHHGLNPQPEQDEGRKEDTGARSTADKLPLFFQVSQCYSSTPTTGTPSRASGSGCPRTCTRSSSFAVVTISIAIACLDVFIIRHILNDRSRLSARTIISRVFFRTYKLSFLSIFFGGKTIVFRGKRMIIRLFRLDAGSSSPPHEMRNCGCHL
mmetsp:Transcript_25690/g.42139  ORF Transcript_25690/g.42139 Transcript_25690/m.42139 type:complete len:272 (+) Transcript_25690:347-1162(+)